MNICLISSRFFPSIVGSGVSAYLTAQELARRGHSVTVLTDKLLEGKLSENSSCKFDIEYISGLEDFAMGNAGFRKVTTDIYDALQQKSYDIVQVNNFMPMLLISLMKDLIDAPIVFTFYNTPDIGKRAIGYYEDPALDVGLARFIITKAAYKRIVAVSRQYFDQALYLGAEKAKISFAYTGIDQDQFTNDMKSYDPYEVVNGYVDLGEIGSSSLIFLPGRITPRKGILQAIESIPKIKGLFEIKLIITGMAEPFDKEFARRVMEKAKKLGVEAHILIPNKKVIRRHLPAFYKISDIVMVPSEYEGLGLVAIEALLASRPLIVCAVPGLSEVAKNNVNAITIPNNNPTNIARATCRLLGDSKLAARLGTQGPKTVRKFDIRNYVDVLEEVYREETPR